MAKRMPVAAGGGWAAPDPVLDLAAVADGIGGVTLTWTQAFGATGYDIQRSLTNGNFATIASDQTGATYYDSSGSPTTLYYFRIIAKRNQVPSLPSSVVSATTTSSFTGVLDAHTTNLSVAWSLTRRLLTSYTGALFRVRRDADDAEQDIGYVTNGDVDTSALQAFVGSDDAYLVTPYRQDGSSDHPTQATAGSQPRIALAGVMEDGILFSAGQFLDIASAAQSVYTDGTNVQVVCEVNADAAGGRMFDFGPDLLSAWFPLAGTVYLDLPFPAGRVSAATPGGLTGSYHVCSIEREGATARLRTDGSVDITGAAGGSISGTSIFRIGGATGGTGLWSGLMRGMVIWKDCASPATRAAALA